MNKKFGINLHIYPSTYVNESKVLREAYAIKKLGYFSEILLIGVKEKNLLKKEFLDENIVIVRISKIYKGKNLFIKALSFFIWNIKIIFFLFSKKISMISCHSLNCLPLSVFLKLITFSKIIYVAHELETERNGLNKISKYLSKVVERFLIRNVDASLFICKSIEDWYLDKYKLKSITDVIYNCPIQENYVDSNIFRETFKINDKKPIFLYQGIISKGRGIYNMIDTFKRLSNEAYLVILGYGELQDYVIKEASNNNNIFYHPAVKSDKLMTYTCSADFGLSLIENTSLSYDFCLPNKLFEYISAFLPVVVSPTKEQSNFVINNRIGVVCKSLKIKDIYEAIIKIIKADDKFFRHNLTTVKNQYRWSIQEKKINKLYDNLINN